MPNRPGIRFAGFDAFHSQKISRNEEAFVTSKSGEARSGLIGEK
jgi:hypothetical protein